MIHFSESPFPPKQRWKDVATMDGSKSTLSWRWEGENRDHFPTMKYRFFCSSTVTNYVPFLHTTHHHESLKTLNIQVKK